MNTNVDGLTSDAVRSMVQPSGMERKVTSRENKSEARGPDRHCSAENSENANQRGKHTANRAFTREELT